MARTGFPTRGAILQLTKISEKPPWKREKFIRTSINVKLQRPFIIVGVDISEFIYVCSFLNLKMG